MQDQGIEPITIFIMHFNRSWMLMQCVAAIRENTRYPYKIVIQDHASTTAHKEHIKPLAGPDCDIFFCDKFYSCLDGRRVGLEIIPTSRTVFLDDDIKVSPLWLSNLVAVMESTGAAAVPANLISDVNAGPDQGQTYQLSGLRRIQCGEIVKAPFKYMGQGELCHGGATLYAKAMLEATEYRQEYNGSFEDWDQLLQITRDLGGTVWGSSVVMFHHHKQESKVPAYWDRRWRWMDCIKSALAAWDRWGIKTGVRNTYIEMMRQNVPIPDDLQARIDAVEIMLKTQPVPMPEDFRSAAVKRQLRNKELWVRD